MNQETPPQSGSPLPVRRDRKRARLSDLGVITETHISEPTVPVTPLPPPPPPLSKPWPTRLAKDDIVALEQRIRYLDRLIDDAGENTAKARRRVEELRYGAGSLAKIHVTDSIRTSVTQEEYGIARDEEIRSEIHRDQHRKISGGQRRVSEPPRLIRTPESKIEKMRRISMGTTVGRDPRVGDQAATRGKFVREQIGKDNVAKEQATKDGYASREQRAGDRIPKEYSEKGLEEPKIKERPRAPEAIPDLKLKKTRDRTTLRVPMASGRGQGQEGYEGHAKKDSDPK
ncbi:hypothetical protein AOL_s00083g300 [Orbilia oligospora ATCC 24927]|uniref:Uncharacterized protein n=2 Tax=Orbilia oligospora TaxID=2813651 RepID=G1XH19_ARTOA|nr:hypothetical protein AOL_s00083g300 [Orbilia oligospora ATCC 24927]EGX47792.1 hypothetical protein AOL_s00083g300 [Orbilia oligospora ATCC 24927]KAF3285372.1 hypothetical protein TWF970_010432 [Orbilia oligospora]